MSDGPASPHLRAYDASHRQPRQAAKDAPDVRQTHEAVIFVGLSSWIIQDGNYGEFRVGDYAKFALEFYPITARLSQGHAPSMERLEASRYRVRGQVIYTDRSVWVIDFGLGAYQNHAAPRFAKTGSWIEGDIDLGIDPFFYFEGLYALQGMPELRYDWRIKGLWLETTPWLTSKDDKGRSMLTRDDSRESFAEVAETNAWQDDGGLANYILECVEVSRKKDGADTT